jgi:hypothetical protein
MSTFFAPVLRRRAFAAAVLLATTTLAACDDVTDPPRLAEGEFTVDAATEWQFVSLADSALVAPGSPRTSGAWDIAFFSTNVTLNGGQAGPGDVTGYCVCQNAGATNEQLLAMTAESERADFEAVTSVPANATFSSEVLTAAMGGWYTGPAANPVADPSKVFLVRLSDGVSYAKVHATSLTLSGSVFTEVVLEYAVQASATAAFGPTRTITLRPQQPQVDLNVGSETTNQAQWDIRLEGTTLLVNGGVSGSGSAAVADATTSFASTTTAATQPQAYRTDRYAGVFGSTPWYKYNLAGDNRITPTFNVYILKRGTTAYKVQVINYYSAAGAPRNITFRYQQIAQ